MAPLRLMDARRCRRWRDALQASMPHGRMAACGQERSVTTVS